MFQQPKCRDWITIEINRFSATTRRWKHQDFFPEKFNNFNGCELVVLAGYPHELAIQIDTRWKGTGGNLSDGFVWGWAIDFSAELAHYQNFTIHYTTLSFATRQWSNESLKWDYIVFTSSLREIFYKKRHELHITTPFTTADRLILISRFKPYTQFEKLILPFDEEVWHWLIVALITAMVTIFVVKLTAKEVQRFVFGRFVTTPMLNFT